MAERLGSASEQTPMNTTQNSFELGCIRLVLHWLHMGYGRICHALWLRLPDSIAMHSRLGSHALAWGGYWANMTWSVPNKALSKLCKVSPDQSSLP